MQNQNMVVYFCGDFLDFELGKIVMDYYVVLVVDGIRMNYSGFSEFQVCDNEF